MACQNTCTMNITEITFNFDRRHGEVEAQIHLQSEIIWSSLLCEYLKKYNKTLFCPIIVTTFQRTTTLTIKVTMQ